MGCQAKLQEMTGHLLHYDFTEGVIALRDDEKLSTKAQQGGGLFKCLADLWRRTYSGSVGHETDDVGDVRKERFAHPLAPDVNCHLIGVFIPAVYRTRRDLGARGDVGSREVIEAAGECRLND